MRNDIRRINRTQNLKMAFDGMAFLVAYVHTCYIVKVIFQQNFSAGKHRGLGYASSKLWVACLYGGVLGICDFHNTIFPKRLATRYVYRFWKQTFKMQFFLRFYKNTFAEIFLHIIVIYFLSFKRFFQCTVLWKIGYYNSPWNTIIKIKT